jgi:hypothetical protein
MTPHISDTLFLCIVAASFVAVCLSHIFRTVGLWVLRVTLIAFGVLYFLSSYTYLSFGIQMAHAFNSNDTSGEGIRFVYFTLLFAYYGFALVTCFTKPPDARWFVPVVAVTSPIVAFWQQSGMFATAMLPYRALHAFCFVLVWFRIYDLRRQMQQPNKSPEPTPTAP